MGEFDPHVEPLAMSEEDGGKARVAPANQRPRLFEGIEVQ